MVWLLLSVLLATAADYRLEIEKWRAGQEAALRADDGWLTLIALAWLQEGENRISLPEGAPDFGVFELRAGRVTLHPPDGAPPLPMRPDSAGRPTIVTRGSYSLFIIERGPKIGVRVRDRNSTSRSEFSGMRWFPVSESWRIEARWEPFAPPRKVAITNVLGDVSEETSPGRAVFEVRGEEWSLEPVVSGRKLFFNFRDGTSGKETYAAGRFLYSDMPVDGKVILDFNQAVNPPCAFTPFATCPLPPSQNRLSLRIEAGELTSHVSPSAPVR